MLPYVGRVYFRVLEHSPEFQSQNADELAVHPHELAACKHS